MKRSIFVPDAERGETIELPVSAFLLRHARGNVLFDTGCHPTVMTDPALRWGGMAKIMTPVGPPDENVPAQLGLLGLSPDDIDIVVASHLHSDHCGCNLFFRKATLFCHALELEAACQPDAEKSGYFDADWKDAAAVRAFDEECDVFGDGSIRLVPLPGHTPGMTGGLVELGSGARFLLASDAASLRNSVDQRVVPRNTWNAERFLQSIEVIRTIGAGGATIVCGHDDAQWQEMRKGSDAYS